MNSIFFYSNTVRLHATSIVHFKRRSRIYLKIDRFASKEKKNNVHEVQNGHDFNMIDMQFKWLISFDFYEDLPPKTIQNDCIIWTFWIDNGFETPANLWTNHAYCADNTHKKKEISFSKEKKRKRYGVLIRLHSLLFTRYQWIRWIISYDV